MTTKLSQLPVITTLLTSLKSDSLTSINPRQVQAHYSLCAPSVITKLTHLNTKFASELGLEADEPFVPKGQSWAANYGGHQFGQYFRACVLIS